MMLTILQYVAFKFTEYCFSQIYWNYSLDLGLEDIFPVRKGKKQ